jgi:hypothetical protein
MEITKRERHLLWMLLHLRIHWYLYACSSYERDGDRARDHIYISKILCHYITAKGGLWTIRGLDDECPRGWFDVHNYLANHLTSFMDETIGFVVDRKMTVDEHKACVRKFFQWILDHISEIEDVINKSDLHEFLCNEEEDF